MDLSTTVDRYLSLLAASDAAGLAALFADDGVVDSPFLGRQPASSFFVQLMRSTRRNILLDRDVLVSTRHPRRALALFTYRWETADGPTVEFRCADAFDFDEAGRVTLLTILYDTAPIRAQVGDKYGRTAR